MSRPVMDVAFGRPAPRLLTCIDRYVGYRFEGYPPGVHHGLPSRHLAVVISLDAPLDLVRMPDPTQPPASFQTSVGGLHAAPTTIAHNGTQIGVSLDLAPLGARRLLGLPAAALGLEVLDLRDLLGAPAVELLDRLHEAQTWANRFAILDDVLGRVLLDGPEPRAEVGEAWRRLLATGGALDVGTLAQEVGWSRRHLSAQFRRELGVPPKVAARVLRFERAARLLRHHNRPSLSVVAYACGYADQAHLTRDWRDLAGCTPTRWLAEELPPISSDSEFPNLQDGALKHVAS